MPLIAPGDDIERLDRVRTCLLSQLAERDSAYAADAPVFPWNLVTRACSYVFDLPAKALRQVRLHADTINGTLGANYYLNYGKIDGRAAAQANGYLFLGDGVPRRAWAREHDVPGLEELRFGFSYEGLTICDITVPRQQNLCNIHRLLAASPRLPGRSVFVEIGAGYGSFAVDALRAFDDPCYVIVDLPETLIYSASYLAAQRPDLRLYVYTPGDDVDSLLADIDRYDAAFLPNYRASALAGLPYVDVGFNAISFPEMGMDAVRGYLALIAPKLRRFFLSANHRYFRQNEELRDCTEPDRGGGGVALDSLLGAQLHLFPALSDYENQLGIGENDHRDITFWPTQVGVTGRCAPVQGVELRCVSPAFGRAVIRGASLEACPTLTRAT